MYRLLRFIGGSIVAVLGYRDGDVSGLVWMTAGAVIAVSAIVGYISSRTEDPTARPPGTASHLHPPGP